MNARIAITGVLLLAVASAGAGCESGGAPKAEAGVPGCQPAVSGGGTMSWLHDGTPECADSATGTLTNTMIDTRFELRGAAPTVGIVMNVSTIFAPGPIGGTYTCAPSGSLSVIFYYMLGQNSYGPQSCELKLNMQGTEGVHATGTFFATFMPPVDGMTAITGGVFDVPVTIRNP